MVRAGLDGTDLRVDQASHGLEEDRVADRFGKQPDPAAGGGEVGAIVKAECTVDVGEEAVRLGAIVNAAMESVDEVPQKRCEEIFFVGKVVMDESGSHVGFHGHCRDGRTRIAVIGEDAGEGGKDLSAAFGAVARSTHRLVV